MPIVDKVLFAILVAVALSPIYGAGSWLKWQDMKKATILPLGSWTGHHGGTVSFLLKGACYLALVLLVPALGWWVAGTFVVIWFASWKNSGSSYVPSWVKLDKKRFPLVKDEQGNTLKILSTFSEEACNADAKAFATLMEHIRQIDGSCQRERGIWVLRRIE